MNFSHKNWIKFFIIFSCLFSLSPQLFATEIETYWNEHTVNSRQFLTPEESIWYLSWRNEQYPFFKELMFADSKELEGKVIIDYGAGIGNDLVQFLVYSNAKKIIGVDVSDKAIALAKKRIALHENYNTNRVSLVKISDETPKLPLEDNSIDFIHCCGVLMHTSHPELILREFHRVLKPGGKVRIMVYNRDSIWTHLYVGYQKMVLGQPMEHAVASDTYHNRLETLNKTLDQMFNLSTDGVKCPKAINYSPSEFLKLGRNNGFKTKMLGAYFSKLELDTFKVFHTKLKELPFKEKINKESLEFIEQLKVGADGMPKYRGINAGIGAIYEFERAESTN